MNIIAIPLNALMRLCYSWVGNYFWTIVLFTLLTKIILFAVSCWTQRNSIRMVELMPDLNRMKVKFFGDKDTIAEETQKLYQEKKYHPILSTVPMFIQLILLIGVIGAVRALLAGTESIYSALPVERGGAALLMPAAAGCSALALGLAQNKLNPLQREQSKASQWMTNGLSIAISLALGAFVPLGVGLYWICSNLFTILQQLVLNKVIPPEKYVDYAELAESKKELAEIEGLSSGISAEDKRREKEDYKRFFSVANKHLVFYSEKSGYYKYFQDVIEYLLSHSNVTIHYVTSDSSDQIFEIAKRQPHIRPYYIGEKRLITLFMKMDADIVVMTMPDLENFHIKRSYVRKDVEYIYIVHYMGSGNLLLRNKALAHYDTIFCAGELQREELRAEERVYGLPERNLLLCGYGLLDHMSAQYEKIPDTPHERPQILIAPSWQKDNILELCIHPLLSSLLEGDRYSVIVRPHPEFVKRYPQKIADLKTRYHDKLDENLTIQTDFSSNETVFQSDLIITDWSTICYDYAYTTLRPVLFIDTPMKIMNPEYQKLSIVPVDVSARNVLGLSIPPEKTDHARQYAEELLQNKDRYAEAILSEREKNIANPGNSGKIGGQYIIKSLQAKSQKTDSRGEP